MCIRDSALGSIGEGAVDAVPALIQALQDEHVRGNAAMALGQIGTSEALEAAVPTLIKVLQDPDAEGRFRSIVARMLGEIGTPEALKAVEEYQSQQ